jgi:CheY-like chemotaxis protein
VVLEPSLVIIDLAIHLQAGWDLLEQLHAAVVTNDIPVFVVSTDPEYLERVQADGARYGGQRFVSKPFDIDDLLGAVADLIGPA